MPTATPSPKTALEPTVLFSVIVLVLLTTKMPLLLNSVINSETVLPVMPVSVEPRATLVTGPSAVSPVVMELNREAKHSTGLTQPKTTLSKPKPKLVKLLIQRPVISPVPDGASGKHMVPAPVHVDHRTEVLIQQRLDIDVGMTPTVNDAAMETRTSMLPTKLIATTNNVTKKTVPTVTLKNVPMFAAGSNGETGPLVHPTAHRESRPVPAMVPKPVPNPRARAPSVQARSHPWPTVPPALTNTLDADRLQLLSVEIFDSKVNSNKCAPNIAVSVPSEENDLLELQSVLLLISMWTSTFSSILLDLTKY